MTARVRVWWRTLTTAYSVVMLMAESRHELTDAVQKGHQQ